MRQGLLIIHLGTPERLSLFSIAIFLARFLTDKRVIQLPFLLRFILIYGFIIPFRLCLIMRNYQKIWRKQGSPLRIENHKLLKALQKKCAGKYKVALAMRYSPPSIQTALDTLKTCEHIILLPLYPHYSDATTGTTLEAVFRVLNQWSPIPTLRIITSFYDHPAFINAQVAQIKPFLKKHDFILFSYHGLPVQHLVPMICPKLCEGACPTTQKNPCYRAQCHITTERLAKTLALKKIAYQTSFQSRLGRTAWLAPDTETLFPSLLQQGIQHLLIVCPGFTSDCLETLEEIAIRAKARWLALGGKSLTLVPALNDSKFWVDAITEICQLD